MNRAVAVSTRSSSYFSTAALLISSGWCVFSANFWTQEPESDFVPFLYLLVVGASLGIAAAANVDFLDHWGRIGIWFLTGFLIASALLGVFSFGWLLLPALLFTGIALLSWPRDRNHPISNKDGIIAELLGFVSAPVIVITLASLF